MCEIPNILRLAGEPVAASWTPNWGYCGGLLCQSGVVESYVLRLPKMDEQHSQHMERIPAAQLSLHIDGRAFAAREPRDLPLQLSFTYLEAPLNLRYYNTS